MSNLTTKCPECRAEIVIEDDVEVGEMVFCDECGMGFIIVSLKPVKLEREEDYYEEEE